jgi:dTMP kinase
MSKLVSRGAFIVVEGIDKSGKTTQCAKLVDRLVGDGVKAQLLKFPARETATGQLINEYLQCKSELDDHAIHLLFSANRWEAVSAIKKLLHDGITLIVDRYAFSGVAFSAAKNGMDLHWCIQPDVGLPQPDAVIYLTLDVDQAAKRSLYGHERYEDISMQKKVADIYQKLKSSNWKEIDVGDRSIDDVHNEMHSITLSIVQSVGNTDIGKLWWPASNSASTGHFTGGDVDSTQKN